MKKLISAILAVLILGSGMGISSDLSIAAKTTNDFIPDQIYPVTLDIAGGSSVYATLATNGNPKLGVQYFIVDQPSNGTVDPDGLSGYIRYTPTTPGSSAVLDSFTFKICRSGIKAKDQVEGVNCTGKQTVTVIDSAFQSISLNVTDTFRTGIIWGASTDHFNNYFDSSIYTIEFNGAVINTTPDAGYVLNPTGLGLVTPPTSGVSQILYYRDTIANPLLTVPGTRFSYIYFGTPNKDFKFPYKVFENGALIEYGEIILDAN